MSIQIKNLKELKTHLKEGQNLTIYDKAEERAFIAYITWINKERFSVKPTFEPAFWVEFGSQDTWVFDGSNIVTKLILISSFNNAKVKTYTKLHITLSD